MKGKRELLYPAKTNTLNGEVYGYINKAGKIVIYPQYDRAGFFTEEGVAVVTKKGETGVINLKGQYVIKPKYDDIEAFSEGLAVASTKTGRVVINTEGEEITKKEYSYISKFQEGMALVAEVNDMGMYMYGYINSNGEEVIPLKYIEGEEFKNGIALVKNEVMVYEIINPKGEIIKEYNYEYVDGLNDGLMVFSDNYAGPYGYIDINGNVVMDKIYYTAMPFENGLAVVSIKNGYDEPLGVINTKGEWVFSSLYTNIKILGEGRVALGLDRDEKKRFNSYVYALGDDKGKIITDFKFYDIERFENGLSSVYDEKNSYFIDLNGKSYEDFGKLEGSGTLSIKGDLVYSNIDIEPKYYSLKGKLIYEPNKDIKLNGKSKILIDKYKPNVDYLVYYPSIIQERCKQAQIDINNRLKEESKLIKIEGNEVLDYNYVGNFFVKFYDRDLLVLNLNSYKYPYGAAHGMPTQKTPNINLSTGEFYKLEDLFLKNLPWRREINNIIKEEIENNPKYDYVFKDVFNGIKEEQDFYVDKNNLYIYFPPYEIGPYSAGFITFKIPFSELEDLINKRGSFYRSFH
ncbi:MAG: WG repeat-containing protein [Clostridium sp.]